MEYLSCLCIVSWCVSALQTFALRCYKVLAFMNITTHTYALNNKVLIKVLSIVILCRDAHTRNFGHNKIKQGILAT